MNISEIVHKVEQELEQQSSLVPVDKVISQQDLKVYYDALAFSKLSVPYKINVRNVRIYENDYIHEIYTANQNIELPHMLMIHGFGGTGITFIRLFESLYPHYQVHSIDAFGIGYSSRGDWKEDLSPQQVQNYFVNSIEQWRIALKIDCFQIVGHSYGGYLATLYAKKHPRRISRLVLLSPAGFTSKSQQEIANSPWHQQFRAKFGSFFFNMNVKPSDTLRNCVFGGMILQMVTGRRLKLQGQQKNLWKKYLLNLIKEQSSSEKSFYILFAWPLVPVRGTIMEILKSQNFQFRTQIYYGDRDWMQRTTGAQKKIHDQFQHNKVFCERINNADHQVIMDNPSEVSQKLLRNKGVNFQQDRSEVVIKQASIKTENNID